MSIQHDRDSDSFFVPDLTSMACISKSEARRAISRGLLKAKVGQTSVNKSSSRSHTVFILQPIVSYGDCEYTLGGQLTVIDMAGVERTKKSAVSGEAMRESIAINSSVGNVMSCLRTIRSNIDKEKSNKKTSIVPYRESKLTMLLQPVLSGMIGKTMVTMFVSAYPGSTDYCEKRYLLKEVQSLRGLEFKAPKSPPKVRNDRLTSTKKWMQKSPLRHIPEAFTSIQETALKGSSQKRSEEKNEQESMYEELKSAKNESRYLREKNDALEANCRHLEQVNVALLERVKELEERENERVTLNQVASEEPSSGFHEEDIEIEREKRRKVQSLIASPLQKHVEEVSKAREMRSGALQKAQKNPFTLTLPESWCGQRLCSPQMEGKENIGSEMKKEVTTDQYLGVLK